MDHAVFESNAQNREDVVLWRALHDVGIGRYVDVGANHPRADSVSRAFYDRGWRGITIEPMQAYAALQREQRPEDRLVEAAITETGGGTIVLHEFEGTGLSTTLDSISEKHRGNGLDFIDVSVPTTRLDDVLHEAGWAGLDIHFMTVDVEGAEEQVLHSLDLSRWRPWVLVVEATLPELLDGVSAPIIAEPAFAEWEQYVLDAGYQFCLFDGLSRFYVAAEHAERLAPRLRYPACILDNFVQFQVQELRADVENITQDAIRWRAAALTRWSDAIAVRNSEFIRIEAEVGRLQAEMAAIRRTVSWRVTAPLRAVRGRSGARS